MDCISENLSACELGAPQPACGERSEPQAGAGALVNIAKFAATFREVLDEKTGEIQRFRYDHKRFEFVLDLGDESEARNQRFTLQSASRRLLPSERVSKCLRSLVSDGDVALLKHLETSKVHFGGLQTCGSVWHCPICAAKVSERRKLEIREAVDTHIAAGGGVEMVTLTVRHGREDVLQRLMDCLRVALSKMRAHRDYKELRKLFAVVGSIRALEVTHGQANGWHPHFHELWLFPAPLTVRQRTTLQRLLFSAWKASSVAAGLPAPNRQRGVHIQRAESAADYVSKWGCEPRWEVGSELAKANSKRSKTKGKTPFDLLRDYSSGDKQAGALFAEFAKAFKGFNQVRWTPGLKAAFGIADVSNEEIAASQDERATKLGRVRKAQWSMVLRQPFETRPLVLRVAETGGFPAVQRFMRSLLVAHLRRLASVSSLPPLCTRTARNCVALRRLRRDTARKQSRPAVRYLSVWPVEVLPPRQFALRLS